MNEPGPAAQELAERPTVSPAKGLSGALSRYRIMAFVTGVILAVMTVIGLPYRLILDPPVVAAWYSFGWFAHGWLYVAYVATALDLVFRLKWNVGRALLIVLAGTIPFASFFAERYVSHRVEPLLRATDRARPKG